MNELPDVAGSGQLVPNGRERGGPDADGPMRDTPVRDGPECHSGDGDRGGRDAPAEGRDGALPVRQIADRPAGRRVRRTHDPEVLEQVLQSLLNLQ
jgi:hypothetical protein